MKRRSKPILISTIHPKTRLIPVEHMAIAYGTMKLLGWKPYAINWAEEYLQWPLVFSRMVSSTPAFGVWMDNEGLTLMAY